MTHKKLLNCIVDILLASVAGFSFVYAFTSSLNFSYPLVRIYIIVLAVIVFYSLVFMNKVTLMVTGISVGVLSFCTAIYFVLTDSIQKEIYRISLPISWFIGYIGRIESINPTYEKFIVHLLCFVISTAIYIILIRKFNFYILFIATASLYSIQHILNYITTLIPFYISLVIFMIYYLKYIYLKKLPADQYGKSGTVVFTVYSIPLCILIIVIAFLIPAGKKPIEWKWMDAKISAAYNSILEIIDNRKSSGFFSLKETGFERSIRNLGGKVKLDDTIVLKVKSPVRIYLKGYCGDIYTGSSWTKSSNNTSPLDDSINGFSIDLLEYTTGIQFLGYNRATIEQLLDEQTIEIEYENIRTRTLFVPVKAFEIEATDIEQSGISTDPEGILSYNSLLKKGFMYSIKMYNPRINDEEFINLLRKSQKGLYEMFEEFINFIGRLGRIRRSSYRAILEDISKLSEYSEEVYSRYLQLPENLPERVRELALSITENHRNNYDKVKAVEQYLAKNYPYTLNPKPVTPGNDFVDSFLFDIREGYCTYYASAMAVLLRCAGIPARYVEGYMLPPKAESDGTYLVTNNQAHAWTEVYFEGIGWIPFEPTSPFVSGFYADEEFTSQITSSFMSDPYYNEYMENLYDYGNTNIDLSSSNSDGDVVVENSTKPEAFSPMVILFIPVLLICIIVFFNFIKHNLRLRKISNMPPKESILSIYKYYLKVLNAQKHGIKPGETPLSYSEKIDFLFFFRPNSFKYITEIFIKARYSTAVPSNQERQEVLSFYKSLMLETKENLGAIRFWLLKYFLGRI